MPLWSMSMSLPCRRKLCAIRLYRSLRLVDAFALVLRLFENDAVMHVDGSVDPERDWKNVELELILNDSPWSRSDSNAWRKTSGG